MSLSCFELGEQMLSVDAAREALMTLVASPVATEQVALSSAHGRRLAEDIIAPIDVPQNTNAAMDGVARLGPKRLPTLPISLSWGAPSPGRRLPTRCLRASVYASPPVRRSPGYRYGDHA